MKKLKQNRGITLISLAITIIILTIISSIVIGSLVDNGILLSSKTAKMDSLKSTYLDLLELCRIELLSDPSSSRISGEEFINRYQIKIDSYDEFDDCEKDRLDYDLLRIITTEGFVFDISPDYVKYCGLIDNLDPSDPIVSLDFADYDNEILILPGETKNIDFSVKNYNYIRSNNVLLNYYINIDISILNFPVTYKLYDITDGNEIELTPESDNNDFGPINLSDHGNQEKIYRIVLIWNADSNNIQYAGKTCKCTINIKEKDQFNNILVSKDLDIKSYDCALLSANVERISEEENKFIVSITNDNPYSITCNINGSENFVVTYNGKADETELNIPANSSETIEVNFESQSNELYVDAQRDSNNKIYTFFDMFVNASHPYNGNTRKIAENLKIYLLETAKSILVANAGDIYEYKEGEKFSGSSSSNEKNLCSIIDPVSGEIEYFYRGNITNNYIKFAGNTWRILRINDDGSLRLILDNIISEKSSYADSNKTSSDNTIDGAIKLINWKDSNVYSKLNTWYNNNIGNNSSYSKYIVKTKFSFETSYSYSQSSATSNSVYYFDPYIRIGGDGNNFKPTFSYTDQSLVEDNIGLITADEIVYAGGYWNQNNTNFFLYNKNVSTDSWTMSPSFWDDNTKKAGMLVLGSSGKIHDWPSNGNTLTASLGIRPVISIKGDVFLSGDGTSSSPYEIK